jgi:hypothetical protein
VLPLSRTVSEKQGGEADNGAGVLNVAGSEVRWRWWSWRDDVIGAAFCVGFIVLTGRPLLSFIHSAGWPPDLGSWAIELLLLISFTIFVGLPSKELLSMILNSTTVRSMGILSGSRPRPSAASGVGGSLWGTLRELN